jgi:hypothetical protein
VEEFWRVGRNAGGTLILGQEEERVLDVKAQLRSRLVRIPFFWPEGRRGFVHWAECSGGFYFMVTCFTRGMKDRTFNFRIEGLDTLCPLVCLLALDRVLVVVFLTKGLRKILLTSG